MVTFVEPIKFLQQCHEEKKMSNDEMFTQISVGRILLSFDQY